MVLACLLGVMMWKPDLGWCEISSREETSCDTNQEFWLACLILTTAYEAYTNLYDFSSYKHSNQGFGHCSVYFLKGKATKLMISCTPTPVNERMFSEKALKGNLMFQPSIFSCEHIVFRQINPLNISLWQWQILLERNSSWGTPWKFNIAPENIPSQKKSSLPTIISQVPC